jgi:hypothetical protein
MEEQAQNLIDATTAAYKAGKIANNPFGNKGGAAIPPPSNLSSLMPPRQVGPPPGMQQGPPPGMMPGMMPPGMNMMMMGMNPGMMGMRPMMGGMGGMGPMMAMGPMGPMGPMRPPMMQDHPQRK